MARKSAINIRTTPTFDGARGRVGSGVLFVCLLAALIAASSLAVADSMGAPPQGVITPWPADLKLNAEFERDVPAKQAALADLRNRFVAKPPRVTAEAGDLAKVRSYIKQIDPDGRFIDLQPPTTSDWATALTRLNAISAAFKRLSPAEQSANRSQLLKSIALYCHYAVAHPDPFVGAAFGAPRNAVAIYFSLYDQLQSADAADAVAALKDCVFLCWYWPVVDGDERRKLEPHHLDVFLHDAHFTVGNTTYRPILECAVMLDDTRMMDVVHTIVTRSLANRTAYQIESDTLWGPQGLTMDGNGFAHGRQSYLFGYVRDWFNGVCSIATQSRGTPWAISPDSWDLAADMILDGAQWYVYRGDVDWSIAGRHNMYPGPIGKGSEGLQQAVKQLLDVSEGHVNRGAELTAMRDRLTAKSDFDGNRYFWNAEDMIHRRKDYYISVNLSSIRSNGPESVSPFSTVNYFMAQGAMMIKTRGDEYLQTRGAINYAALPGVTSDPSLPLPKDETWAGFPGGSDFCGGVSDGRIGVCGFIYKPTHFPITAKKGYFFFDDYLVALGAGVTTGSIETTINQTAWGDNAQYGDHGSAITIDAAGVDLKRTLTATGWFYNDGVGYLVLPGAMPAVVRLQAAKRQTRWAELARINADKKEAAPTEVPVFQLSIAQITGHDTYAYAVLPDTQPHAIAAAAASPPFTVVSNTPQVQAVRHSDGGVIEAIFYEPGSVDCGSITIAVDRPAIVMLRPAGDSYKLLVSDPLQRDPAGEIKITTTATAGHGQMSTFELPERPWIGRPAEASIAAGAHK